MYVYVCFTCMYVNVPIPTHTVPAEAGRRSYSSSGTGVTDGLVATMWALRIEPKFSGRTGSVLHH